MRNTLMTIAAVLTLSTAAYAGEAPMATAQPIAATSNDRVVCHYAVHDGVLIRKPICKRQADWNRDRRTERNDFAIFQNRTYVLPFGK